MSAITLPDHQDHRAEIEVLQRFTVFQVCMSRGREESWDLGISVPHTEETLQQLHRSRDVKYLALATKWPHPRPRLPENLRLYHGNMVFPAIWLREYPLKDRERLRRMKIIWVFAHRPEAGSSIGLQTIFQTEPQRNLMLKIGCWKRNTKDLGKME